MDGAPAETGVKAYAEARVVAERRLDGSLFVHALLPNPRNMTVVGGPSYEFFNLFAKTNYPPSNPAVAAESREAGKWRIEIAPATASKADTFLNVLEIGGSGAQPSPTDSIRSKGGIAGARFRNQAVVFAAGQLPVRYQVTSAASLDHLVVHLPALAEVTILVNGKVLGRQKVSAQGVLRFDHAKAARRVEVRAVTR